MRPAAIGPFELLRDRFTGRFSRIAGRTRKLMAIAILLLGAFENALAKSTATCLQGGSSCEHIVLRNESELEAEWIQGKDGSFSTLTVYEGVRSKNRFTFTTELWHITSDIHKDETGNLYFTGSALGLGPETSFLFIGNQAYSLPYTYHSFLIKIERDSWAISVRFFQTVTGTTPRITGSGEGIYFADTTCRQGERDCQLGILKLDFNLQSKGFREISAKDFGGRYLAFIRRTEALDTGLLVEASTLFCRWDNSSCSDMSTVIPLPF